jgi:hypothetical protein
MGRQSNARAVGKQVASRRDRVRLRRFGARDANFVVALHRNQVGGRFRRTRIGTIRDHEDLYAGFLPIR